MGRARRSVVAVMLALAVLAAGCGDDGAADDDVAADDEPSAETTPAAGAATSTAAVTTTAAPPGVDPTGVGIRTVTFVDPSRPTPPSGDVAGTDERVLETVISYPAAVDPEAGPVPDAAPATDRGPYPLVVFSHGLGGSPEAAQDLIDSWVTAGFVVAAPRFPLSRPDAPAGPDAGDVGNQPGDVSFLITALTGPAPDGEFPPPGLIDPERVATAGHSNGGITTLGITAHTCCADRRLDAVIVMAGTPSPFAGGEYDWALAPPLLVVHGTDDALVSHTEGVRIVNQVSGPKGLLSIIGGDHGGWFRQGVDGHADVARVTTDFLAAYVTGDAAAVDHLTAETTSDSTTLWFAAEPGSDEVIPTTTVAGIDRRVEADPVAALVDGSVVTVSWDGFTPGAAVNVVQCAGGGDSGAGLCDLTAARILLPNPTGAGSVDLEIIVGAVGEGTCGPESTDCVIVVNEAGLTDPSATVIVPLEFAA